jgi:hypothetical protein
MDQWLYSISDHCFNDLTNYRQNCYSSIVDGIVFPTSNAAHFHILQVFHQVKQWIGEVDNTKRSSPMNAAIPVEEAYKILTDEKQNGHLVLLDAKAAFDKVIHSHLVVNVDVSYFQSYTYILQTV